MDRSVSVDVLIVRESRPFGGRYCPGLCFSVFQAHVAFARPDVRARRRRALRVTGRFRCHGTARKRVRRPLETPGFEAIPRQLDRRVRNCRRFRHALARRRSELLPRESLRVWVIRVNVSCNSREHVYVYEQLPGTVTPGRHGRDDGVDAAATLRQRFAPSLSVDDVMGRRHGLVKNSSGALLWWMLVFTSRRRELFFSSSSNNSTRSLDVVVVGRSKKPRKRVERLSPHLYERDDSSSGAFFCKTTNKSFPPKNKKETSFFHHFLPSFSFGVPPFAHFRLKNRRKIEKYLGFWKRERRMSSKTSARKQNTHTQERKKKPREQKAHKRVQVKVRDRFRPFFPLTLLRVRCETERARVEISRERAPFSFFSKDSEKKHQTKSSFCAFPICVRSEFISLQRKVHANENVSVSASLLIKENRTHQICIQKRALQKRETRVLERVENKKLSFLSFSSFLVIGEKERSSQRKKKTKISRENKGGKEHIWTKKTKKY